ncbi:MAG: tetratricopeptide repeat protein [Rhodospirillales bacterium]
MTTPKTTFAGLALIAALGAGFTLGLTAPAWAGFSEGVAAYKRGDYAAALRELRPLAERGDAKAQYGLGVMYTKGLGVPQDDAKALQWYRRAAEQGDAGAQTILGLMYRNGEGVPQDDAKALQWYRKAAEQGHAIAQNNLGFMYSRGQAVPRDYVQAHMWFTIAASRFPPGKARDKTVINRDRVAKRMTPAEISQAEKLAREWRPKK